MQGSITNPIGNYDGENHPLPDGTYYDTTSPNTRIYRNPWPFTSVSDLAFYSWVNPL